MLGKLLHLLTRKDSVRKPTLIELLNEAHEEHICSLREQLKFERELNRRIVLGPEISTQNDVGKMVPTGRPQWREVRSKLEAQHKIPVEREKQKEYWEKKAAEVELEIGVGAARTRKQWEDDTPLDLSKELTTEALRNAERNIGAG